MEYQNSNLMVYFQFYLRLKNDILRKDLAPGARLATLDELADQYGVSNGSVRRALDMLEREGLIQKKRGAGIFVSQDATLAMWTPSSTTDTLDAIRAMHIEPLGDGWIVPPRRVELHFKGDAEAFDDGRIFWLKRLARHVMDERHRTISEIFLPAWLMRRFKPEELRSKLILAVLWKISGLERARIEQVVRPWLCDQESAPLIGLTEGTPAFFRTWTFKDPAGRVLFVTESLLSVHALTRDLEITIDPEPALV